MMWHWDDVSMSEQRDKEITKSMMLWSDDIFENWGENKIEMQCI